MVLYGGRMEEIPESATPFPHRAGELYSIQYLIYWSEESAWNFKKYITWTRKLYNYLTPNVSKLPRQAYINYRGLDIEVNNVCGNITYA